MFRKSSHSRDSFVDSLKVGNKVVFIYDNHSKSFTSKLKIDNKSCRFVSFVVRPSNAVRFKIKPKFGYIPPGESVEVLLITQGVSRFDEISKDFFGVYAVPIYDRRQLEKDKLELLWRAHGTKLFPYESSEFYKIPYVLPKDDSYFGNLSLAGRIGLMSSTSRLIPSTPCDHDTLVNDDPPVDDETFLLNWPIEGPNARGDPVLDQMLMDWRKLARKINHQTTAIIHTSKIIFATFVTTGTTLIAMTYLYMHDLIPFSISDAVKDRPGRNVAKQQEILNEQQSESSWLSWFGF